MQPIFAPMGAGLEERGQEALIILMLGHALFPRTAQHPALYGDDDGVDNIISVELFLDLLQMFPNGAFTDPFGCGNLLRDLTHRTTCVHDVRGTRFHFAVTGTGFVALQGHGRIGRSRKGGQLGQVVKNCDTTTVEMEFCSRRRSSRGVWNERRGGA